MQRKFKNNQKFIIYEIIEDKPVPRLFQIINPDNLACQIDGAEKDFIFYTIPQIETDTKIYITDLDKYTYIPLIDKSIFILKCICNSIGNLEAGFISGDYADKISNRLPYYAVEIGKYNAPHFIEPKDDISFYTPTMGEEWVLNEYDVENMEKYDLFIYAEEIGLLDYCDIYTEEINDLITSRNNIDVKGMEDVRDNFDGQIYIAKFNQFKNCDVHCLMNCTNIPVSYFETYIDEIKQFKQSLLDKNKYLEQLTKDNIQKIYEIEQFLIYNNKI